MSLLLDSDALLWLLWGSTRLGSHTRARIEAESRLMVSDVTLFEVSLKAARKKITLPPHVGALVEQVGIMRVVVTDANLDRMREPPPHHRDPFDRYLIAQALVDGVPIVTSDPVFALYGVQVVDARR